MIEFERLGRRIEPAEARALPTSTRAIPLPLLLLSDANAERAELFWRLSVPILAFVLTLLAIPLAQVNPRMGRSINLFAAAFLYMLYTNCINIVQSLIAQGKLELWLRIAVAACDRAGAGRAAVPPPPVDLPGSSAGPPRDAAKPA